MCYFPFSIRTLIFPTEYVFFRHHFFSSSFQKRLEHNEFCLMKSLANIRGGKKLCFEYSREHPCIVSKLRTL